jgi:flagellar biosynthesis protein FlhF
MRLKTFTALSTSDAMRLVRDEMGDEAIILSTRRSGRMVCITAALEDTAADDNMAMEEAVPAADRLAETLAFHGVPADIIDRLRREAMAIAVDDPVLALAGALDAVFEFHPLPDDAIDGDDRPIMLVGPPGVGKTVTVAKLAARAALKGRAVEVVTTDTRRAGGIEQLAAFMRLIGADLKTASGAQTLVDAVAPAPAGAAIYIDSAGSNPFDEAEMRELAALADAVNAETVLVLAAGSDTRESAETACRFAAIGARRLLATRLDIARRIGGILTAADAAHLKFCDVSVTPHIADGLNPINPVSLARLILPDDAGEEIRYEAAS